MENKRPMQTGPGLAEGLSANRRRLIMLGVAVGTMMGPLDASVVNIALPHISDTYHVSLASVEWVVTAYLVVISSLLLTFGRLGDMYGHKNIYVAGFTVFTVGSFLCGSASSLVMLVLFRVLQAVGAGMLMAMGPAIVTDVAPPNERGKFLGIIGVSVSVALTIGPVLGGLLTARFGWPSIFYINIPIGILAASLAWVVIPRARAREKQRFDIAGSVTVFVSLLATLVALSFGEKIGWGNPLIASSLVVGILLMIFYVFLEKRVSQPMMDLTLFNNRLFAMGNLSALLNFIGIYSVIFIMPFYLQQLRGLSPSAAGWLMIPSPLTTMIVAPIAGTVSDRVDTRYVSAVGMAITTAGLLALSTLGPDSSNLYIILGLVIVGLGTGLFQTPNNSSILGTVPPFRRGIASGLLATMRNLGMVLGVAVSGAVFTGYKAVLMTRLAATGISGAELNAQAFAGALRLAFIVSAIIALAGVFTSLVKGMVKIKDTPGTQQP